MEGSTEDSVGGGSEGDREVEDPMQDPGPPGGRKMQPGGAGLPLLHGCGEAGTSRGRHGERGVGSGAAGVGGLTGSGS